MDIYGLVNTRFSVRQYKSDPVPMEVVQRILEAALRAPSWGNKQCWRFIIVDSQVEKNIIGKASGQEPIAKACVEAPFVIVLCAEDEQSGVKNGLGYFMFDCGLAMQNLVLAAHAEGLGTCITGWHDEKTIKAILNIPDSIRVVAYTPLGYPNESLKVRGRKKKEEIVFYNQWGK